ncbi:MAG: flagellar biosynthesis protein FlhF [Lachnospiraceae bacterium]|nr:flagellar biosynthesis protein FlhF [Lachnospiraceae bacterium]
MIIKKYKATTEKDAILMAKEDLGPEAVVMNVKTIKRKGIMKLFKKNTVELTAAIDDNVAEKKSSDKKSEEKTSDKKNQDGYSEEAQNAIEEKINSIARLLEQQMLSGNEKEQASGKEEKTAGTKIDYSVTDDTVPGLRHIAENDNGTPESVSKNKVIELIYNQLLDNEVEKKIADDIINELDTENYKLPIDNILANVYQKIVLKLGEVKPLAIGERKPKVVFFVGNTGVGKTTTMAKLASKFKLENKMNIAMLSIDTYRIAAIEQIKTYANILNTPMEVVYTPEDIKNYVEKYKECDLIFVDTAGHSHRNEEQKKNLKEMVDSVSEYETEVFLVVSAVVKYNDLVDIAKTYDKLFDYKLIFTKLDETRALGSILNLKIDMNKTLSYATWGQNVPEDIGVVNPQIIAKSLLGGDGNGSGF